MNVRCQNCGERLVASLAKPTDTTVEVICHSCGVTMRVRVPPTDKNTRHSHDFSPAEDEPRPSEQTWKRVFEPVPRLLIYLVGMVLAAVLLSPFWVVWLQERYGRNPIILSEDTAGLTVPPMTNNTITPIMTVPETPPTTLDQYHNVRLETGRDDVQHRFNLVLQNTRGMEPEIYEGNKGIEFERFTAHFYESTLKEVWLIRREQRTTAGAIQKDLVEQFNAPVEQSEITGPLSSRFLISFAVDEMTHKLDNLAFHRSLTWTDAQYRVEATIHYSSADPTQCRSVLTLHMSSAAWMKKRQPLINVVPPR